MHWNVPNELTPDEQRLVARMRRKSRFYVFLRKTRKVVRVGQANQRIRG